MTDLDLVSISIVVVLAVGYAAMMTVSAWIGLAHSTNARVVEPEAFFAALLWPVFLPLLIGYALANRKKSNRPVDDLCPGCRERGPLR